MVEEKGRSENADAVGVKELGEDAIAGDVEITGNGKAVEAGVIENGRNVDGRKRKRGRIANTCAKKMRRDGKKACDLREGKAVLDKVVDIVETKENEGFGGQAETKDIEMGEVAQTGIDEEGKVDGRTRKRGRNAKTHANTSMKKIGDDVCFICLDGGDLFLCDHRRCTKAYHPLCVKRDTSFFQSKIRWNCGWHICSFCEKNANYMCCTCTFSLCKGCINKATFYPVRGNKGFCETCMKTVMLIENSDQNTMEMQAQVDFDDKSSWEYLFKDYWLELKGRLLITSDDVFQAKCLWKGSKLSPGGQELHADHSGAHNDGGSKPDSFSKDEVRGSRRKYMEKWSKAYPAKDNSSGEMMAIDDKTEDSSGERDANKISSLDGISKWASNELLEFVMHMRNGDKSFMSKFEVKALLIEYVANNKLRNPRWKSQIICDSRLQNLFRKPCVGHFEMFNLLESHFPKENFQHDDIHESAVNAETSQPGALMKMKCKMNQKNLKDEEMGLQESLTHYAAIDIHNMNLIYLRRYCVEELLGDVKSFHDKVVGSFVRIAVSGSQNQEFYRLVQVIGTKKTTDPYQAGKRVTDIELEVLNLNKVEYVSINVISNQGFNEDECKRLQQTIRCGLMDPLTVGKILDKAMALWAVRVNDPLKALEERQQRIEEVPKIHTDPNMNPSRKSGEDEDKTDDKRHGNNYRSGAPSESWSMDKTVSTINQDLTQNSFSKGLLRKGTDDFSINQGSGSEMQPMNVETLKPESDSLTSDKLSHILEVPESLSSVVAKHMSDLSAAGVAQSIKINMLEKQWCYRDPSSKIQGPFSMAQLHKWSKTFFPSDLRIWRSTEKEEDSILFTKALVGKFPKELSDVAKSALNADSVFGPDGSSIYSGDLHGTSSQQMKGLQCGGNHGTKLESGFSNVRAITLNEESRHSTSRDSANNTVGNDFINLPQTPLSDDKNEQSYLSNFISSSTSLEVAGSLIGLNGEEDYQNFIKVSQIPGPEKMHSEYVMSFESQEAHTVTTLNPNSDTLTSTNSGTDMRNTDESQQHPLTTVPTQAPVFGQWGSASSAIIRSASSNPSGSSAVPAIRAVLPFETPMPQNPNFSMVLTENSVQYPRQGKENPNTKWGTMPGNSDLGWERPPSDNSNKHWGDCSQGPANESVNMGLPSSWQLPAQENTNIFSVPTNPAQEPVDANTSLAPPRWRPLGNSDLGWERMPSENSNKHWGARSQGPANESVNKGFSPWQKKTNLFSVPTNAAQEPVDSKTSFAPPKWQPLGNPNCGSSAPSVKSGMCGREGSFSFESNGNSHDKDSGYGRGKSWNWQSSFGSGSSFSKPLQNGRRICKFYETGYCRNGAHCNYLHQ